MEFLIIRWNVLSDLGPFVQFKKGGKNQWRNQENFNKSNTAPSVPNCAKCHMYSDVEKVNLFAHGELINSQEH